MWSLNHVECKYTINGMLHEKWNLHPTIRQCFGPPQEEQLDIVTNKKEGTNILIDES